MAAIDLDAVTKQYSGVTALHEFDLTVEEGEVYGFLGPYVFSAVCEFGREPR